MKKLHFLTAVLATLTLASCAVSETSTGINLQTQPSAIVHNTNPAFQPYKVAVVRFDNASNYNNGIFADANTLSKQGMQALINDMATSGYFTVMNRSAMETARYESKLANQNYKAIGADYIVIGSITEFGRRNQGDKQLFGIIGSGKQQVAYAKVTLNLISTKNSSIVASVAGAGQISINQRQVLGFGSQSSYDSAQNAKVLGLAIREAVNNLTAKLQRR